MENSICKIVYFDEDSVTDYVQIIAGGELEKTTQLLKETDKNVNTDASVSGKAGISGVFKALLGLEAQASADASMGISLNTNKMAKNIVKNTILTDFLGILNDEKQNRKYCYANYSQESVVKNCSKYDPESPILCGILDKNDKITERKVKSLKEQQLSIFDF